MSRIRIFGESADFFNTTEGVIITDSGNEIGLFGKKVGEDYLRKCAEYFGQLPAELRETLCEASAAYLTDIVEEHAEEYDTDYLPELTSRNVLTFLKPVELRTEAHDILSEEDMPPAFSLKLEFTPVPVEAVEWVVRGEDAMYVGEYRGVSPWNDNLSGKRWNYIREA